MPFTFSHPAIILPLCSNRKYFSMSGLIMGSLIPDFEYFIRMRVNMEYSHNLIGVLWFDLPFAILLLFIFHNITRDYLIDNLIKFLKIRLIRYKYLDWNNYFKKNWFKIIISVIIGTLSHLLWDSFTHSSGYFIQVFPSLKNSIDILIFRIPIYNVLQHLSTILGGIAIMYYIYKMPKSCNIKNNKINVKYWGIIGISTASIMLLRFKEGVEFKYYGNIIVSLIAALLLSLIFTPIILNSIKKLLVNWR